MVNREKQFVPFSGKVRKAVEGLCLGKYILMIADRGEVSLWSLVEIMKAFVKCKKEEIKTWY